MNPFRHISKSEKEKLGVVHKSYDFFARKMKMLWLGELGGK